MLTGKHLIAGEWHDGAATFSSSPATGAAHAFAVGTKTDVARAAEAAEAAFAAFSQTTRVQRAAFLDRIADEIDMRADEITVIGSQETALPEARLINERGRTINQLKMFARHIEAGDYLDRRYDPAQPQRQPLPRPDLRLMQRPLGPVAVFGASNFPLAFSVAGGDTASALAAGCPVVVKAHPAHPGTSELAAQAIASAVKACGLHPGVFSFLQGGSNEAGTALVQHPLIKAVGFTGSFAAGRALFDLCAQRPEPIPFFGELGSINPVFILPQAASARAAAIGAGWAGSLTLGVGQFCTNPGIAVVCKGPHSQAFIDAVQQALCNVPAQTMLTDGIAAAYDAGVKRWGTVRGVESRLAGGTAHRHASPALFVTSGKEWLANAVLGAEVFGPAGLVVEVSGFDEMQAVARQLEGQLTCTLQLDEGDYAQGRVLLPLLERKSGRLLANAFPTGVEVCDSMVHGGPYPASTNFGATSVGSMAIRRFLRPVCYQDIPTSLLPEDLR